MITIRRFHVIVVLLTLLFLALITHFYKKEIKELIFVLSNMMK